MRYTFLEKTRLFARHAVDQTPTYLRWVSYLCAIMAAFGVAIMLVGYKDPSFGRVATVVCLAIAAGITFMLSRRLNSREE